MAKTIKDTKEYLRLQEGKKEIVPPWRQWGSYVSARSWGTIREDYSLDGNAWDYFPFDHANFRVYRWGEDGIGGICDRYQHIVFSAAFWNEKDPILKERYFGLTGEQGNHGEDVKDYYYYIDATPTFSYAKMLYKYPQEAFPYEKLIEENKKRSLQETEYELINTGIFDEDRYFDIFIEYAKSSTEDICIKIEAFNRGSDPANLHILPHLIFRNTWSWGTKNLVEPSIHLEETESEYCLVADDSNTEVTKAIIQQQRLKKRYLYSSKNCTPLFTNNETNFEKLCKEKNKSPYTKDAFHEKLIHNKDVTNPEQKGTKACLHFKFEKIPSGKSETIYLRITDEVKKSSLNDVEKIFSERKKEADEFYSQTLSKNATEDEKLVQRQAFAGMIWTQQIYLFDVNVWLEGDNPERPASEKRKEIRNNHWRQLNSMRIFSMPDKWEYPWFAAWDLAFQCTTLARLDLEFAKEQLWLLLFDQFQHPNGQIPAYEWNFSDVNPPVQGWAALKIFEYEDRVLHNKDYAFLEKCLHKLLLNFSWWVNKIDIQGNNIFEGGFLGLDNIEIIDRSFKLPDGQLLDQADGSGWMAMFCLNLMKISLILSEKNENYQLLATKFFEHYVYIAAALRKGYWRNYDMFDSEDGFFYSSIRYPNSDHKQLRMRSLVGIIPLYAAEVLEEEEIKKFKDFHRDFHWFCSNRSHLTDKCVETMKVNGKEKHIFCLLNQDELKRILKYVWDPNEFRSDYGFRSISKIYEKNPFQFADQKVKYEPGESEVKIKGGNSNWRGPIWLPTTYLLIDSLRKLGKGFDRDLKVQIEGEDPVTLEKMAQGFSDRLIKLFTKEKNNLRPIYRDWKKFCEDPNFFNYVLFFEHYHGDNGRGLGASHQTGWSGLIANLIDEFR